MRSSHSKSSYISISEGDKNDFKEKVAMLGIGSVWVPIGNYPFISYTGGILDDEECNCAGVDHAVNIVDKSKAGGLFKG